MKLSKNFSLAEFTRSDTARRLGIDNDPSGAHLQNSMDLFEYVIQPVRDHFGPTQISSGYRSAALNRAINGSSRSQHSRGEACDFECKGVDNKEVVDWIIDELSFDQLILEFYDDSDINAGWIHCSYVNEALNRNQVLRANKLVGKTVYTTY